MIAMYSKESAFLCTNCGSEAAVVYSSYIKKLIKRVQFCPFCGWSLKKEPTASLIHFDKIDGDV